MCKAYPWLFSIVQSRITQLTSRSRAALGSKSIPAAGGVPAVPFSTHRSISRFSALITLIPCR